MLRVAVSVIIFELLLLCACTLTSVAKEQQQQHLGSHVDAHENHSKIYFHKVNDIITKRIQSTTHFLSHSGQHLGTKSPPRRILQCWANKVSEKLQNRHPLVEIRKSREEDNFGSAVEKHMTIKLSICIVAILIYVAIGAIAYSHVLEKWSILDSLYFSVVTFTTVGYGDLSPTTELSKLFTAFYSLVGISILGVALGVIGSNVVQYETRLIAKVHRVASDFRMVFLSNRKDKNPVMESSSVDKSVMLPLWKACVPVVVVLLLGSVVIAQTEGWGYMNAFYFCTLTAVTVGYGDEVHSTKLMRTLAIIYIPILVGVMSHFLGAVARVIMDVQRNSLLQHMQHRELKPSDLRDMDSDGDGIVTESDFIVFMLSKMYEVDNRLLDQLKKYFRSLAHSGRISCPTCKQHQ